MYYDGDIDLEDIECRLYSQVYHSNTENEDANITSGSNLWSPAYSKIQNKSSRYFSKTAADHSAFIPLEGQTTNNSEKTCSSVHNSISVGPNSTGITSEGNFGNPFQNNITVNQYTVPLIINPELNDILNPGTFFVPWAVKNKKLLDKKIKKRLKRSESRRRKYQEKRNQNTGNINIKIRPNEATHIVYISDDSDGECVVASDMCKQIINTEEKPRAILENIGSESDDDIIYVPPPPVEIINVDVDNEEDKTEIIEVSEDTVVSTEQNKSTSTLNNSNCEPSNPTELLNSPESCTANDFLDNPGEGENGTNKFNFSLHGSDFTNTGDFARPANPVDYCETESSCSTNDFNKENNSVKTIVFNEVDFPKEDIFSDKNLESFSTYITPKRSTIKKARVASKLLKPASQTLSEDEGSLSSSESDYESSVININTKVDEEHNKKLPTLSPMQCAMVIITNTKNNKNKSAKDTCCKSQQESTRSRRDSTKRKSNTLDSTDSDSDNDVEPEVTRKLAKKKKKICTKKKNSLGNVDDSVSIDQQNTNSTTNTDVDNDATSNEEETVETNVSEKRAKKKIKNSAEKVLDKEKCVKEKDDVSTHTNEANSGDCSELINEEPENNIVSTSRKKKKKNSANCSKYEADLTPTINSKEITIEKVKRKKKKSLSSENSVTDISTTELNRSRVGFEDIGNKSVKNEISNNKNSSTSDSNKINDVSLDVVADQPQEKEKSVTSTGQSEIKIDRAMPRHDSAETFRDSLDSTAGNVSQESVEDEEIIVVDEPVPHKSDANLEDCIEIMESSDSDYDFTDLADVGPNIELANCSIDLKKITDDDKSDSVNTCIQNKNLCEDYSKFDVNQIQDTQSDDPQVWKISAKDRLTYLNPGTSKGPRCNRCRHFGHIAIRCPEKPDPPNCSLCGFPGHQEPRCPHKRCTQCGNEGDYSTTYCWKCVKFRNLICRICNMKGHVAKFCPDLWRRYHLTTEGPIVASQEPQLKPTDQLWCSGCAKQGHLEHECNYYNREYPPTNPCVVSYEDVLNQEDNNPPRNNTPSPPPPPVWIPPEQNNFYQNVSSFPNFPSTSRNISFNTPIFSLPLPLIPQVPNLNPMFSVPAMLGQNGILGPGPNINCHPNFAPVSTKVLNPFSVLVTHDRDSTTNMALDQMLSDYLKNESDIEHAGSYESEKGRVIHPRMVKQGINELQRNSQRKVKQIMMSMPPHVVKEFLSKELDELENAVGQSDPKYLRKKLFKYDRLSQSKRVLDCAIVKEKFFWDRVLNMYIFGVHKWKDGKIHMDYLRKFLSEPKQNKFDGIKRKCLLNAYNYVYDGNRHVNVNYYRVIQQLIDRYNERN